MIPSLDKPRYKSLVRLRADIWNNLKTKSLKNKKWRSLISFLNRRRKKKKPNLISYTHKSLPKFPVYFRYKYQKNLFIRKSIKIIYGNLQEYKIKQIALYSKRKSWMGFTHRLEQNAVTFIYRFKLTSTYGEALIHFKHKRVLVNGGSRKPYIRKGDVLHFNPCIEKLLKRRICYNFKFSKFRRIKYEIPACIDFEVSSLRFYFLDNIKYFKNHPFRLPFEKLWRWYTRV